jgi:hypothetical protein
VWRIDEALLPPGSQIRYRPPSLWREYRGTILVTAGVIAAQTALIVLLFIQRRLLRGARNTAEMVRLALRHGLVDPPNEG